MVLLRGQALKRREFIGIMAGAATWPLNVRAQQSPRVRHIGVFLYAKDDQTTVITPFLSRLQALGYIDGKNVTIEYRHGEGNFETLSESSPRAGPLESGCDLLVWRRISPDHKESD
jgi:putative ABC transport system substrate-binding protein